MIELKHPVSLTSSPPRWRLSNSARRVGSGFATSAALHAGLLAIIFAAAHWPARNRQRFSEAAMSIQLAAAPESPAVTPHDTPPEPVQKPVPPTHEEVPDLPQVPNAPDAVAVPPPKSEPPPIPQPAPTPPSTPAAPVATVSAAPTIGQPTSGVSSDQQSWEGKVLAKLERLKRFPPEAMRAGEQDVIYVRISLNRKGRVLDSGIVKSRHLPLLDDAVRDLVRRASPFPALPASIAGDPYEIVVPVDFFVDQK